MTPRHPSFGEANLAALTAAVIGCIGGLFALGVAPSIIEHDVQYLAAYPKLNVFSFFVSGTAGWFIGGQIGPRLECLFNPHRSLIVGGIIGGILPVAGMVGLGWFLFTH